MLPQEPNATSAQKTGRSPLFVIFMTVFIDLVGFGIILPLSPYLAREFNASSFEIGLLVAVYSFFQFVFSPIWGGLSDRIGRRPVILVSLAGGALSYLLLAFAQSLEVVFIARALAGVFGGNLSTAQAYIADVTTAENRSKGMGLFGAAFGLGFIFGPLIGGLLSVVGAKLGDAPPFGMSFSAVGAFAICALNFLLAIKVLKESLPESVRGQARKRPPRSALILDHLKKPLVGSLIWVFFFSGLAMAQMEAMLFPFMDDRFGWGVHQSSYGFAYVGVLMVLTQGVLIRRLMPKYGEPKILAVGLLLFAASLIGIAFCYSIGLMAVMMTFLALGNGLMRPPNLGMISLMTPPEEQGITMGVTQSLASLGRIIGPIVGGLLYERISQSAPFFAAGTLTLLALFLVVSRFQKLPSSARASVGAA